MEENYQFTIGLSNHSEKMVFQYYLKIQLEYTSYKELITKFTILQINDILNTLTIFLLATIMIFLITDFLPSNLVILKLQKGNNYEIYLVTSLAEFFLDVFLTIMIPIVHKRKFGLIFTEEFVKIV